MDTEFLKIKNSEYYPSGYFFHLSISRSGHNFIRKNIQSWTNDINEDIRKYINLENHKVENMCHLLENNDFCKYPNSIYIISVRSLLNWYSSFFYFHLRYVNVSNKTHQNYSSKIFIFKHDLVKTPKLEENPNIIVLQDNESKNDYIEKRTRLNKVPDNDIFLSLNLDKWLLLAKELIGETNNLPQFTKIYYDEFFKSREYRKEICNKIGGDYSEANLNTVSMAGNYSTFDGEKFQGKAQQMNVLERYKEWKPEHQKYLNILKEHEAWEFYAENFEVTEGEEKMLEITSNGIYK